MYSLVAYIELNFNLIVNRNIYFSIFFCVKVISVLILWNKAVRLVKFSIWYGLKEKQRIPLLATGKLALWQNWRSGKTGALAKLALWQTGALANWRSGRWIKSQKRRSFWRMAFRVVIDDVRHSLYNYHILFITRIILYIICNMFCALLQSLITQLL